MSPFTIIAFALLAACAGFGGLFFVGRTLKNFSLVDVGWAAGLVALAIGYGVAGPGWAPRRGILMLMATAWGLRLAVHLAVRIARLHPQEDGRYVQLRRDWAGRLDLTMAGFYQLQAAALVVLSLPFLAISRNPRRDFSVLEIAGAAVWLVALVGEAVADAQLARFKASRVSGVLSGGLWRYSRHPNYFFQWLAWVGIALVAWPAPGGWTGFLSAAVMLFLLRRVTGVRYTEEHLVRTRGPAYVEYQRRTPAFVPWLPKPDRHDRLPPGASRLGAQAFRLPD